MQDLVSIILPIYKVENYIDKCVNSVINQTYRNIEIILVDDGSPDNCPRICDEYKKVDNRIKVIHKENGGLSDARNAGMDVATGKYIAFIDPDDYVSKDYIEILYENITKNDADISICSFIKVNDGENDKQIEINKNIVHTFSRMQAFENLYNKEYALNTIVAWNKLYKRELWNDLLYPKGKIHEDEFVICNLIQKSNKIVYTDKVLYYYVQHKSSITGNGYNEKTFDKFEAFEKRANFFKEISYIQLYEKCLYELCLANRMVYISTDNKVLKNKLNSQFKIVSKQYIKEKFSMKRKAKILILKFSPFVLNIKRR